MMNAELDITKRSFQFAVRIVKICRFFEKKNGVPKTLANQLLRAGTSIGANLEEAQAGHSKADFTAKIGIARKEARVPMSEATTRPDRAQRETVPRLYWLKLLKAAEFVQAEKLSGITKEADELVRSLTSITDYLLVKPGYRVRRPPVYNARSQKKPGSFHTGTASHPQHVPLLCGLP